MPKYLNKDGLTTLWAHIINKFNTMVGTTPVAEQIDDKIEALKGSSNGLAGLDETGRVPSSQLPSYVDDVEEYDSVDNFPDEGTSGKMYLDLSTNLVWRWSGSAYVEISPSLALGETAASAYRGDRGAAAYKHAVTNKGAAFGSGLYKITTNAEGHVTAATAVAKADITGLGIPAQDTTYEEATTSAAGLMSTGDKSKLNSIVLSSLVKSVNGVGPDENGNVSIEVGGGTVSGDYLPLTGGTLSGNLIINNSNSTGGFVALIEDNEGGTIQIGSKTGAYTYEIDAYNDEILRVHTAVKNPNGGMKSLTWNGRSGNFTVDSFTGKWLGDTIEIGRGGTGATTALDACTNLSALYLGAASTAIEANSDLNSFTTPGCYRCGSGTTAATLANCPYSSNGFRLNVFTATNASVITQEIHTGGTHRVFHRNGTRSNNVWTFGNWVEMFSTAGGTLTDNLTISNANNYSYLYLANKDKQNIGGLYASDGENRLYLINHAPNSTTGKYEGYGLPAATDENLTDHKWYRILTSKETVTVAQGGTGATTAEGALVNLGLRVTPYIGSGDYSDIKDLNDLTLTGLFQVAGNFANAPLTSPCFVFSICSNNSRYTQFAWRSTSTTAAKTVYMRKYDGSWSDWEIVAGPGLISGYLPLAGGTITGTLSSTKTSQAFAIGTTAKPTLTAISMGTNDPGTRMYFTHYDQNSSYYDNFVLPGTKDLTKNGNYWILTTKSPVTIAQGGTGATDAATALANLGGRRVYYSVEQLGLTTPATIVNIFKAMPSHSSLVLQSANYAQIAQADSPVQWGTFIIDKTGTYGHATCVTATSTHVLYDAYFYQSSTTATPTFSGWKKVVTEVDFTDNKVTQTLTEDATKDTNWYLLASNSQSTGTRGTVFTKDLRIQSYAGTTSTPGEVEMIIGNKIASGTAGNKEGFITLYSQGSSYHMIKTTSVSSGITHTLPAVSGTVLNSGNYQDYAKLSNLGDVIVSTSTPSSVTNDKWYLIKQG